MVQYCAISDIAIAFLDPSPPVTSISPSTYNIFFFFPPSEPRPDRGPPLTRVPHEEFFRVRVIKNHYAHFVRWSSCIFRVLFAYKNRAL